MVPVRGKDRDREYGEREPAEESSIELPPRFCPLPLFVILRELGEEEDEAPSKMDDRLALRFCPLPLFVIVIRGRGRVELEFRLSTPTHLLTSNVTQRRGSRGPPMT
jgi:hypothetical protein